MAAPFRFATPAADALESADMPHVSASLLDSRGRKYLTAEERERFLAAAREHPTPAVQTFALARVRARFQLKCTVRGEPQIPLNGTTR